MGAFSWASCLNSSKAFPSFVKNQSCLGFGFEPRVLVVGEVHHGVRECWSARVLRWVGKCTQVCGAGSRRGWEPLVCLPSRRLSWAALPTCGAEGARVLFQWLLLVMCCVLGGTRWAWTGLGLARSHPYPFAASLSSSQGAQCQRVE